MPALVAGVCGCGTSRQAAVDSPPVPVQVSVSISDRAVSIAPAVLGAGRALLIASNQSATPLQLDLRRGGVIVSRSGPVAAGGSWQTSVALVRGVYSVTTSLPGETDAQRALARATPSARLLVGRPRASAQRRAAAALNCGAHGFVPMRTRC